MFTLPILAIIFLNIPIVILCLASTIHFAIGNTIPATVGIMVLGTEHPVLSFVAFPSLLSFTYGDWVYLDRVLLVLAMWVYAGWKK